MDRKTYGKALAIFSLISAVIVMLSYSLHELPSWMYDGGIVEGSVIFLTLMLLINAIEIASYVEWKEKRKPKKGP